MGTQTLASRMIDRIRWSIEAGYSLGPADSKVSMSDCSADRCSTKIKTNYCPKTKSSLLVPGLVSRPTDF